MRRGIRLELLSEGPIYDRLLARHRTINGEAGLASSSMLFLVQPMLFSTAWWYMPITVGLLPGPPEEGALRLARGVLEATIRFLEEVDLGEPLTLVDGVHWPSCDMDENCRCGAVA